MNDTNHGFAVAAGIVAAIIAGLGLDPLTVKWAAIGAGAGLLLAAHTKRWITLTSFPLVVLLAAGLAQSMDRIWFGSKEWETLLAIALGFLFHKIVPVLVEHMPDIFRGVLQRLGAKQQRGPDE